MVTNGSHLVDLNAIKCKPTEMFVIFYEIKRLSTKTKLTAPLLLRTFPRYRMSPLGLEVLK